MAALTSYLVIGVIAERWPSHPGLDAKASLLAVGDTDKVHRPLASLLEGQVAVGDGLAAEDRVHPVDAMLLLGDNFYMQGLVGRGCDRRVGGPKLVVRWSVAPDGDQSHVTPTRQRVGRGRALCFACKSGKFAGLSPRVACELRLEDKDVAGPDRKQIRAVESLRVPRS